MWFHRICSCVVKSGTFTALKWCSIRLDTHLFCREFMLIVFIYAYWCPTQFPYQMMFVSFNSTTTGVTCGAGTANPSGAHECTAGFLRGSCSSIFSFLRCGSLFVLLLFFFWPLYYLSIDLQILSNPLVSSNSSHILIFCIAYTMVTRYEGFGITCTLDYQRLALLPEINETCHSPIGFFWWGGYK